MKNLILFLCTLCFIAYTAQAGAGHGHGNLYSISIGINKYKTKNLRFDNCVKDAKLFSEKIKKHNGVGVHDSLAKLGYYKIDTAYTYELYDEEASLENIIKTFQEITLKANRNDVLSLFIAGRTHEIKDGTTVFIPFITDSIDSGFGPLNIDLTKVLSLTDLAKLMNQISCFRQLVVSESGFGNSFASNLLIELFETNPIKASHNVHRRVIITTKYAGLDSYFCGHELLENGPLLTYILKCGNPLGAIFSPDYYELDLIRAEVSCPVNNRRYCRLYDERDYTRFVMNRTTNSDDGKTNSRGGKNTQTFGNADKQQKSPSSKTVAFIVGTNTYNSASSWQNLKNPINDAKSVAGILAKKYGAEVHSYYDATIAEVYTGLNEVIERVRPQDKFWFL